MDKTIYLITRHAVCNYGSLLQTICTVKYFENRGFKCRVINYMSKNESVLKNVQNFSKNKKLSFLKRLAYYFFKFTEESYKYFVFSKMRRRYLKQTKKYKDFNDLSKFFVGKIICSGGDQLRGIMPNGDIDENYFLSFAKESILFSFSSSFGSYKFSESQKKEMKFYLSKYKYITVREPSAVVFLNNMGIKSKQIMDPTLLIQSNFITGLAKKTKYRNYVLVYKLRNNELMDKYANFFAKKYNLKIIYITNSLFLKVKNGRKFANKKLDFVLGLFSNTNLVITDSFHATVLSVIFKKDFYVTLPDKTGTRIIEFLKQINLESRVLRDIDSFKEKASINFNNVENTIISKREKTDSEITELFELLTCSE